MSNFNFDLDSSVDENFFGTLKNNKASKLQLLFGEEDLTEDEKQQSLKYNNPKQVLNKDRQVKAVQDDRRNTSRTLFAKAVTCYKQGELVGKVGLALISNNNENFNIIMYKSKTAVLVTLELVKDKELLFQQQKFWQFYNDEGTYWSFTFDSSEEDDEFQRNLMTNKLRYKISREIGNETPKPPAKSDKIEMDLPVISVKSSENIDLKQNLMKRVAKMGQALPKLSPSVNNTTEFSDSSGTEEISTPLAISAKPVVAPRSTKFSVSRNQQQIMPANASSVPSTVYSINALESQYMQMVLSEQRTQGTELRINISKLDDKLEKVLDKLDFRNHEDSKSSKAKHKDDEILELEEKLLFIKKENRKLKLELQESKSNENNAKWERALLREYEDELEHLEIYNPSDLGATIKDLIAKLGSLKNDLGSMQTKVRKDEKIQLEHERTIMRLKTSVRDYEEEIEQLKQKNRDLNTRAEELQATNVNQEQKLVENEKELTAKKSEKLDQQKIKLIMNNLYADISEKLNSSNLENADAVMSIVAASIREQTLRALK